MWCWKELFVSPVKITDMSLQFRENNPPEEYASQLCNKNILFKAPRQAPSSVGHWTRYISFCVVMF